MKLVLLLVSFVGTSLAQRWHRATGAHCEQGLDLVFLQDTTISFTDDLPIVTQQIPSICQGVEDLFEHSRFTVAEFKDKPIDPFGWAGHDYCYRLLGGLSSSVEDVTLHYGRLYTSAGGDYPEGQFQALINVAYDENVGWRPFATDTNIEEGLSSAHMVVLVTDAKPHVEGDYLKHHDYTFNLLPNPGTIWQDQFEGFCTTYDYPNTDQVKKAVDDRELAVIFLIKPTDDPTVLEAWKWVNNDLLGQPDWFVQTLTENSIDLAPVLVSIMKEVSTYACTYPTDPPTTTTTTVVPTTKDDILKPVGTGNVLTPPPQSTEKDETLKAVGTEAVLVRPNGSSTKSSADHEGDANASASEEGSVNTGDDDGNGSSDDGPTDNKEDSSEKDQAQQGCEACAAASCGCRVNKRFVFDLQPGQPRVEINLNE